MTEWEPREALLAGPDGLDAAAASRFRRRRASPAVAAFEVGAGQAAAVGELLFEAGFATVETRPDLAGIPRVVVGSTDDLGGSWRVGVAMRHQLATEGDAMLVSVERDGGEAARTALERCIAAGGVVVFPADGVYGLACDPLDAEAIARIHRLKGRDDGKPSAVMYFSPLAMRELVAGLGPRDRAPRPRRCCRARSPWSSPTPSIATRWPAARTSSGSASG